MKLNFSLNIHKKKEKENIIKKEFQLKRKKIKSKKNANFFKQNFFKDKRKKKNYLQLESICLKH